MEALLASGDLGTRALGERSLRVLCEQVGCQRAFLLSVDEDATCVLTAQLGPLSLDPEVERWIARHVADESIEEATVLLNGRPPSPPVARDRSEVFAANGWHYRACLLLSTRPSAPPILAVVLLAAERTAPARCPSQLLQRVAAQLERSAVASQNAG